MMKPAVRLLFILGISVVYLGLAVLAGGGFAVFFSNPARYVAVVVSCMMSVVALFAGGNVSPGVREDRGNRWVISAFGVLGLLTVVLPPFTERREFWVFDGNTVRWLGVLLFAAGGALRLWPVFVLGNRFSGLVAIQPGHTLVTDGVYQHIRHPSYLGLLVNSVGWALVFRSGAGLLLTALCLVPILVRIHAEERLLVSQFGAEYEAFHARTWRLVPGIF